MPKLLEVINVVDYDMVQQISLSQYTEYADGVDEFVKSGLNTCAFTYC
jgi:hypothetical protein